MTGAAEGRECRSEEREPEVLGHEDVVVGEQIRVELQLDAGGVEAAIICEWVITVHQERDPR